MFKGFSQKIMFFVVLIINILVVGCTSPTTSPSDTSVSMNQIQNIYQALSITPQPNNQLCWYNADVFGDDWDEFIANHVFGDGLASGLISKNAEKIGFETYKVEPNIPIQFTYRGYYHSTNTDSTLPVRYIALLNEVQLPDAFDDKNFPYQNMVFNYHQTQIFDMTIPPLAEGIHEVIIIGIEQTELFNHGRVGVFVRRITLIVGNPSLVMDITHYELIQPNEYRSNGNTDTYWALSIHSDQSHRMWDDSNIYKPVTKELGFYISAGYMEQYDKQAEHNITPQSQPFALIALLNYIQIPILDDKQVFYGLLSPYNSYSFIPMNIDLSNHSGKKELLIIRINYPRIPNCLLLPVPGGPEGFSFYSSIDVIRHGIDIQNE
jgi:hypothetical protein